MELPKDISSNETTKPQENQDWLKFTRQTIVIIKNLKDNAKKSKMHLITRRT